MKRGLVFSLCALALAAYCSTANAAVNLSLNLHYNDPADPTEGGSFQLVAKTDNAFGISAVNMYLQNINADATLKYGNGTTITATTLGAITNTGGIVFQTPIVPGTFNILYGQDTANGPVVKNVGRGNGTPGNVNATDPLKNPTWNNVALLLSGTFGGTRPAFVTSGTNGADANVFANANTTTPLLSGDVVAAGTVTTTVRGDSLFSLGLNTPGTAGLRAGDANRDFTVSGADFAVLQNNINTSPGTKTWDQADFNDDGNVSGADFALLQNNLGQPATAPQISSVPEPCAFALAIVSAGMAVAFSRKRS